MYFHTLVFSKLKRKWSAGSLKLKMNTCDNTNKYNKAF